MENYDEVDVPDFLDFMKEYLEGKIDAESYRQGFFKLMKKRARFTDDEFRLIQVAFLDADDYDPVVRLEYTILEPELRRRVAMSVALGYEAAPVDTSHPCS
jgi:hypothetical protein